MANRGHTEITNRCHTEVTKWRVQVFFLEGDIFYIRRNRIRKKIERLPQLFTVTLRTRFRTYRTSLVRSKHEISLTLPPCAERLRTNISPEKRRTLQASSTSLPFCLPVAVACVTLGWRYPLFSY